MAHPLSSKSFSKCVGHRSRPFLKEIYCIQVYIRIGKMIYILQGGVMIMIFYNQPSG